MNIKEVNNPHDKLFRRIWADPEAAGQFFEKHLHQGILELINLDSLTTCKETFVDSILKDFYSDVLYSALFGDNQGYLYILLEHKSYFDKLTPLQILRYIEKIWDQHARGTKKKFPPANSYSDDIVSWSGFMGDRN